MTDDRWQTCGEPDAMLVVVNRVAADKQLRLWCCACVRRVWHRLARYEAGRRAVEISEAFARSIADAADLAAAGRAAEEALSRVRVSRARDAIGAAAWCATGEIDALGVARSVSWGATYAAVGQEDAVGIVEEREAQAKLLRDVFHNPFRPTSFDPRWRTTDVLGVASAIYDGRAFDRLPIPADALMDAECDNEEILSHCRNEGPHVRGCWAVDLVMGKE